MSANYYSIICSLIHFKNEIRSIEEKKFKPLISVLHDLRVPDDDEDIVPDNKKLAEILNLPQAKVNSLLKELHNKVVKSFENKTLEITECEQIIYISLPLDEQKKENIKKDSNFYFNNSLYIKVKLPFLPRIGDRISLKFIENILYNSGYVYDVEHRIIGKKQEILISVHPFNNFVYHWKKMEAEYEYDQQRKIQMENEKIWNNLYNR